MRLDLEAVHGLQELRLLVQQLAQRRLLRRVVEVGAVDALRLVPPPRLELGVEDLEVLERTRVHAALDLALVPQLALQALPLLVVLLVRLPLGALLAELPRACAREHAPHVALEDDDLLQFERRQVRRREVRPGQHLLIVVSGVVARTLR